MPKVRDPDDYRLISEYRSEAWRSGLLGELLPVLSRQQPGQVFAYRFDWDEEPDMLVSDLSLMLGAGHGLEVAFVFGTFDIEGRMRFVYTPDNAEARTALSEVMQGYWARFARDGEPGELEGVRWEPWGEQGRYLIFDTEDDDGVRMDAGVRNLPRLLRDVVSDPRLPSTEDKCRMLFWMVRRTSWVPEHLVDKLPGFDCAAYPFDAYPWR